MTTPRLLNRTAKVLSTTPSELKRTTLDPKTRRLLRVTVKDVEETDRILGELMGKDVEARYKFITERAAQADLDL